MGSFSRRGAQIIETAAVVVLILGGTAAGAVEPGGATARGIEAPNLTSDTRFEVAPASSFDELDAVAVADGSVRVIVTLRTRWVPGQLLGGVDRAAQASTIHDLQQHVIDRLQDHSSRVTHRYDYLPALAMELDRGGLAELRASGLAARVQLDEVDRAELSESVPLVNADDVWALGYDGDGESVAVLDTGVDRTHTFLSGRVVGEACFSVYGDCPNGMTEQYGTGAAAPCDYHAACEHGTHVAGIAAGDDRPTLAGVAPGADVVAVQVFSNYLGAPASFTSDQLKALEYVYSVRDTYSIASVNMSLGGDPTHKHACDDDVRKLAIDNLLGAGIVTVIAAGNDSQDDYVSAPGCISTAVTVASSTKSDILSDFSNAGPMVDVIAPGSSIYSSIPGGWAIYSGTSMATPHVAGAWALLKQAYPDAAVDDILAAVKYSPVTVSAAGRDLPRLDVADALTRLSDPWPANDPYADAITLTSPATLAAATGRATTESWEPVVCADPGSETVTDIGATIWYRLDPAYHTEVTIDTAGSDFDTTLGLYQGSSLDTLTPVACGDDFGVDLQARLVAAVVGDATYWLQVGGYLGDTGNLALNLSDSGDISDPPTWPSTTLTATNVLKNAITVSWPAASDDDAVTGYRVYLDGTLKTTTTSRTYTVQGLQPNHSYHFEIEAVDPGGHRTVGPTGTVTTARDFIDTDGLVFEEDIEWLSGAGITQGCNPPVNDMFCPNGNVTRGQMAAFLVRALGLTDQGSVDFVDDDGSLFEASIEMLATAGITKGCNPPLNDMFCPNGNVTRGQMAAFLVRALGLTDQGSVDFVDDDGSLFEASIEMLATAGITKGCNPPVNDMFCPNGNVTRGQMAAFLRRALG